MTCRNGESDQGRCWCGGNNCPQGFDPLAGMGTCDKHLRPWRRLGNYGERIFVVFREI